MSEPAQIYGHKAKREDVRPQLRPARMLLSLLVNAASFYLAAAILPGFHIDSFWSALLVALLVGLLNAGLAPVVSAIRLPYTVATSFLLLLVLDALLLLAADALSSSGVHVDGFGWALLAALVISAISTALEVVAGSNDDDAYT